MVLKSRSEKIPKTTHLVYEACWPLSNWPTPPMLSLSIFCVSNLRWNISLFYLSWRLRQLIALGWFFSCYPHDPQKAAMIIEQWLTIWLFLVTLKRRLNWRTPQWRIRLVAINTGLFFVNKPPLFYSEGSPTTLFRAYMIKHWPLEQSARGNH